MWSAFPDYPPYAGAFADVVPHLSIGAHCGSRLLRGRPRRRDLFAGRRRRSARSIEGCDSPMFHGTNGVCVPETLSAGRDLGTVERVVQVDSAPELTGTRHV